MLWQCVFVLFNLAVFYSITLLMASFLCNTDKTMLTRDTFSGCSILILLFYFRENKQHLRR